MRAVSLYLPPKITMNEIVVSPVSLDTPLTLPIELEGMSGFSGSNGWITNITKHYSYPGIRVTSRASEVNGSLTLLHITHPLFGNYLLSAPYASYGGFAFRSPEVRDALLVKARELADELNVQYAVVRFDGGSATPPPGWIQNPLYCTYITEFPDSLEALFASFSAKHRYYIRKSEKHGLSVRFGHLDLLDDAYEGMAGGMHELGSPFHSKAYFQGMAQLLDTSLSFVAMYDSQGKVAAGGVYVTEGKTVVSLYANVFRRYREENAGEFLYWSAMQHYHQLGIRSFNMGRSPVGPRNEVFKMKWRPKRQELAYWYYLRTLKKIPDINQRNPQLQGAIWTWQHLPRPLVRALGPYLIRGVA